jgi:hypothetical protein
MIVGELDGIITTKQLNELLHWARKQDHRQEQQEMFIDTFLSLWKFVTDQSIGRNLPKDTDRPKKHPGGRPPAFTPVTDYIWYMWVRIVMNQKKCSCTRACELLADLIPCSANGESIARTISRSYKRGRGRQPFTIDVKSGRISYKERRNKLRRVRRILGQLQIAYGFPTKPNSRNEFPTRPIGSITSLQ